MSEVVHVEFPMTDYEVTPPPDRLADRVQLRTALSTERGEVTRFMIQLEYWLEGDWREVVRYDHDRDAAGGHYITEDDDADEVASRLNHARSHYPHSTGSAVTITTTHTNSPPPPLTLILHHQHTPLEPANRPSHPI